MASSPCTNVVATSVPSLAPTAERSARFVRRRYFVADRRKYNYAERMAATLYEAGITAWTDMAYDSALAALMQVNVAFLFTKFDVVCMEYEGERKIIDQIAEEYKICLFELDKQCSKRADAFIDAMSTLARVPGAQLLYDQSWMPQPVLPVSKREDLSRLLGIGELAGFKGWIEKRTEKSVQVHVYLPAAAQNVHGYLAAFPISSCPTLQEKGETAVPVEMAELLESGEDAQLRPYQAEQKDNVLKAWQTARRVMLQMPTGTGKTRLFVSLIRDIQKQQPEAHVLIVAHRTELIGQISQSLTLHYHLPHSILGDKKVFGETTILVASIQMLSRRVGKDERLQSFDYIIIDEAHHSLAPTYKKMLEAYGEAKVLGVTATPYRLKKASFAILYDTLVESAPMRQFLADGYLANYRLFTVSDRAVALGKVNRLTKFGADGDYKAQDLRDILDTEAETERLFDCYSQYAAGKKGLVYAVSRDHAAHITALFNNKGVSAAAIDCDTPREERQRLIDDFKRCDGSLQILVNVELFTEGFDCPAIDFVLLARPTRSLALYLQQVGRALRPSPCGTDVLILDCAGLYNRFGLPERTRDWQAHFKGDTPKREDYTRRPLGSPSVSGLMREVERPRREITHTDGTTCVYTFDCKKYGLCDKGGHAIFRPQYDRITPTPYGWYVGDISDNAIPRQDVLSPADAKAYSFQHIQEEKDCIFSAEITADGKTYLCRFDKSLRLVPDKVIKIEENVDVYQHGAENPFFTTSLALNAPIYNRCVRLKNGITRLQGIRCKDCIIADGEISNFRRLEEIGGTSYTVTTSGLLISPDGTLYRPLRPGFPLHYTKTSDGIALYDAHFSPLLRAVSIDIFPTHCVLHRPLRPSLTINYLDYLRYGLTETTCFCIEHEEIKKYATEKQGSIKIPALSAESKTHRTRIHLIKQ